MIVLKILLWILLAVLGIIVIILLLPIGVRVSFIGGKLSYSVTLAWIDLMDSEGGGLLKKLKKRSSKKKKAPPKKKKDADISSDDEEFELPEAYEEKAEEDNSSHEEDSAAEAAPDTEKAEEKPAEAPVEDEIKAAGEDAPEKEKKKKEKKKKEPEKAPDEEEEKGSKIELMLSIWEAAERPVLKIFKGIKLSGLYIDFIIANEDAYKCALNYGRISGAFYTLLGWLSVLFNVKLKTIDINPGFAMSKSRWDAAVNISTNLMVLVIAGLWFLITYIFKIYLPKKFKTKKK